MDLVPDMRVDAGHSDETDCQAVSSEINLAMYIANKNLKLRDSQAVTSDINPGLYIDNDVSEEIDRQVVLLDEDPVISIVNQNAEPEDLSEIASEISTAMCMDSDDSEPKDLIAVLSEINLGLCMENAVLEPIDCQAVSTELNTAACTYIANAELKDSHAVSSEIIPGICIDDHSLEPKDFQEINTGVCIANDHSYSEDILAICSDIEVVSEIRFDNGHLEPKESQGQEKYEAVPMGNGVAEPKDRQDGMQGDGAGVHLGFQCNVCSGDIVGFRYTCVQCADWDMCAACEARRAHAQHYVLRVPGPRPFGEVQWAVERIRSELARGLAPRPLLDDGTHECIKAEVMEVDLMEDDEGELGAGRKKGGEVDPLRGACAVCACAASVLDNDSKLQEKQKIVNKDQAQSTEESYSTTNVERARNVTAEKNIQCNLPIHAPTETTEINNELVLNIDTPPNSDQELVLIIPDETDYEIETLCVDADTSLRKVDLIAPRKSKVQVNESVSRGVIQKRLRQESCDLQEITEFNNTVFQKDTEMLCNVDINKLAVETDCYIIEEMTDPDCVIVQETTGPNCGLVQFTTVTNYDIVDETTGSNCNLDQETMVSNGDVIQETSASNCDIIEETSISNCDIVQLKTGYNCHIVQGTAVSNSDTLQKTTGSNNTVLQKKIQKIQIPVILPSTPKRKVDMPRKSDNITPYYDVTGGALQKNFGVDTYCDILQGTTEPNRPVAQETTGSNSNTHSFDVTDKVPLARLRKNKDCDIAQKTKRTNNIQNAEVPVFVSETKRNVGKPRKSPKSISSDDVTDDEPLERLTAKTNCDIPLAVKTSNNKQNTETETPRRKVCRPRKLIKSVSSFDVTGGEPMLKEQADCDTPQETKRSNKKQNTEEEKRKRKVGLSKTSDYRSRPDVEHGLSPKRSRVETDCATCHAHETPTPKTTVSEGRRVMRKVFMPEWLTIDANVLKEMIEKMIKSPYPRVVIPKLILKTGSQSVALNRAHKTKSMYEPMKMQSTPITSGMPQKIIQITGTSSVMPQKRIQNTGSSLALQKEKLNTKSPSVDSQKGIKSMKSTSTVRQNTIQNTESHSVVPESTIIHQETSVVTQDWTPNTGSSSEAPKKRIPKTKPTSIVSRNTIQNAGSHSVEQEKRARDPKSISDRSQHGTPDTESVSHVPKKITPKPKSLSVKNPIPKNTVHDTGSHIVVRKKRIRNTESIRVGSQDWIPDTESIIHVPNKRKSKPKSKSFISDSFTQNIGSGSSVPQKKIRNTKPINVGSQDWIPDTESIIDVTKKGTPKSKSTSIVSQYTIQNRSHTVVPQKRIRKNKTCVASQDLTPGTESISYAPKKRTPKTKSTSIVSRNTVQNTGPLCVVPQKRIRNAESISVGSQDLIPDTGVPKERIPKPKHSSIMAKNTIQNTRPHKTIRNTESNSVESRYRIPKTTSVVPQNAEKTDTHSDTPNNILQNTECHSVVPENTENSKTHSVRPQNTENSKTQNSEAYSVTPQNTIQNTENSDTHSAESNKTHSVTPQNTIQNTENSEKHSVTSQNITQTTDWHSVVPQDTENSETHSVTPHSTLQNTDWPSVLPRSSIQSTEWHSVLPQNRKIRSTSVMSQNNLLETESTSVSHNIVTSTKFTNVVPRKITSRSESFNCVPSDSASTSKST